MRKITIKSIVPGDSHRVDYDQSIILGIIISTEMHSLNLSSNKKNLLIKFTL